MSEREIEDRDVAFLLLGRMVFDQVPPTFRSSWVLEQGWFGIDSMANLNLGAYMLCQFGFLKPHASMGFAKMATLDEDSVWDRTPQEQWKLPQYTDFL